MERAPLSRQSLFPHWFAFPLTTETWDGSNPLLFLLNLPTYRYNQLFYSASSQTWDQGFWGQTGILRLQTAPAATPQGNTMRRESSKRHPSPLISDTLRLLLKYRLTCKYFCNTEHMSESQRVVLCLRSSYPPNPSPSPRLLPLSHHRHSGGEDEGTTSLMKLSPQPV